VRVTVLGGGHGALATAADLALRGHEVRLALRNRERFAEVFRTGRIAIEGAAGEGVARLDEVTDDHAAAVRGADLVLVPMPATAQEEIAERIAGAVAPGQVVCLMPGTWGALVMGRRIPQGVFAETATLPYGARQSGPAAVRCALHAHHLPTGVYPARETSRALAVVARAYPQVEAVEDSLSAALLNANGALHAPLVLLNAGPLDRGEYDLHVEGTTPVVRRLIEALDAERVALRRALGYTSPDWPLRDYYADADWLYGPGAFSAVQRRSVWRERLPFEHRYLTEDVGVGLVLWSSLGRALGVPTPLADACIALASALLGRDLRTQGRSLERLGLAGLDPGHLRARL
jgi:opine dehydrogenase